MINLWTSGYLRYVIVISEFESHTNVMAHTDVMAHQETYRPSGLTARMYG